MSFQVLMVLHTLPLWFLVFALFLPRVALFVLWLGGPITPFHLHGIVPLLFAIFLPRVLVLYLIYIGPGDQPVVHHPSGGRADGVGRLGQLQRAAKTLSGCVAHLVEAAPAYNLAMGWKSCRSDCRVLSTGAGLGLPT